MWADAQSGLKPGVTNQYRLFRTLKLGWTEADRYVKKRLSLSLLLVLVTSALSASAPIALKYAVDSFGADHWQDVKYAATDLGVEEILASPTLLGPIVLIAIYVASLWLSRSFSELRAYVFGTADYRLQRMLSRRLFEHVLHLPMPFHLERRTGALHQTLGQGLAGFSILLNHIVLSILPVFAELAIMGFVLTYLFQKAFLVILVLSVCAYAATFALGAMLIAKPSQRVADAQLEAYSTLIDSVLNTETVKSYTAEQYIVGRYDRLLSKCESEWVRFYRSKSMNGLLVTCIFAVSIGSVMAVGAHQVSLGAMTVGDFVMVNAYMLQIVRPIETLGAAFRDITQGIAFINRMDEILGIEREFEVIDAKQPTVEENETGSELVFDQLAFSYVPRHPVLKDLSFTLKPGTTVAIVGPSGAGKSSLVRLLLRLYEPDCGDILLDGFSISKIPLEDLRRTIAVIPQDTILFNDTIAYNIGFGRQGSTMAEIEQAARIADIHDKIEQMPRGYMTVVGERGLKLSGGEKQRISIARATLKKPQIYVFDEATSSLDTKTEREIMRNLIAISTGITTLIIAHRLSTIVHADTIVVMDHGQLVGQGDHNSLLGQNGLYKSMWHAQQKTA